MSVGVHSGIADSGMGTGIPVLTRPCGWADVAALPDAGGLTAKKQTGASGRRACRSGPPVLPARHGRYGLQVQRRGRPPAAVQVPTNHAWGCLRPTEQPPAVAYRSPIQPILGTAPDCFDMRDFDAERPPRSWRGRRDSSGDFCLR